MAQKSISVMLALFHFAFLIALVMLVRTIEMKGITRCKLTIISESGVHKKLLGQIISYPASL
jgi:hypothetical protein